jgi:hypothetical protein
VTIERFVIALAILNLAILGLDLLYSTLAGLLALL